MNVVSQSQRLTEDKIEIIFRFNAFTDNKSIVSEMEGLSKNRKFMLNIIKSLFLKSISAVGVGFVKPQDSLIKGQTSATNVKD